MKYLNTNTGRMNIDKKIYVLFSKTIYHTKEKSTAYLPSDVAGIYDCFKQQKTKFDGSIEWCAVTAKHDMHARGIIEVFTEKGRKLPV